MFSGIDRVYVNEKARAELAWSPAIDFRSLLERLENGEGLWSPLATRVGVKGDHDRGFEDGPYPVVD